MLSACEQIKDAILVEDESDYSDPTFFISYLSTKLNEMIEDDLLREGYIVVDPISGVLIGYDNITLYGNDGVSIKYADNPVEFMEVVKFIRCLEDVYAI